MVKIDFVIVGAQRGGSTALSDEFNGYDGVYVPELELPVFEPKFCNPGALKELDKYFSQGAKLKGIKRPDYLANPVAARNIAHHCEDAHIVAVLRDPIQRFVSAAYWYQYAQLIPVQSLSSIVREAQAFEGSWTEAAMHGNHYAALVNNSLYGQHLTHYRQLFGAESLHVVFQDQLVEDGAAREVAGSLISSISSGHHHYVGHGIVRRNAGIYDPRRLRVLSRRPSTFKWEDWHRFQYIENRLLLTPAKTVASRMFHVLDKYFLRFCLRQNRPQELSAAEEAYLTAVFADDLTRNPINELPARWLTRYGV
jgi:hypothetical protein